MKKLYTICFALIFSSAVVAQFNMDMLGHLSYSEELSDVWGYVDEEGNEYALVGVYNGVSVVDVTDPATPVEVHFSPGPNSIWRDIKTYGDYAYVSNESDEGVFIMDLSPLPNGQITTTSNFTGTAYPFSSSHNLYIDEAGKLYIFGANNGSGGAIICDLAEDPMNPVELGGYSDSYLHDGMAHGDTLWGSSLYTGDLRAIDVSDPANPVIMGTANTPGFFTHNSWVSDDGTHVFTTDEVSSGYIAAYNVTDLSNIVETDRVQAAPGSGVIPHNAHVLGDFVITSYYTEGITVHDVSKPDNIILVGQYDTSPNFSGDGYNGSWGAYPYLPSGNILASDIEEGLYILQPNYLKAIHISGMVKDSISGDPLFAVDYEVMGTDIAGQTAFDGSFEFGTLETGTFDIKFTKEDYNDKILEDVVFENGAILDFEVEMSMPVPTGVNDIADGISVKTFPNPFTTRITLDFALNTTTANLQVFDLTGNLVLERALNGSADKIKFGNDMQPGIYIVKITSGEKILKTSRIVKL